MDAARQEHAGLSIRQACAVVGISVSSFRYKARPRLGDGYYQERLSALAEKYPTWGFWKMYHRLRLDGEKVNHKRLWRIYTWSKLHLRRKARRRVPRRIKEPLVQPLCPNLHWSMDFMHDSLFQGKPFRTFNVIDDFNREALNITVAKSITSDRLILELENLIAWRGKPQSIRVDNGPEFIAQKLEQWCGHEQRKIKLTFIQKGKPHQNGYIERFNRTFREDVLDAHLFDSPARAQEHSNQWLWMYNNERPHESLGNLPPAQFLLKYGKLHTHPLGYTDFPTFQQDDDGDGPEKKERKLLLTSTFDCA